MHHREILALSLSVYIRERMTQLIHIHHASGISPETYPDALVSDCVLARSTYRAPLLLVNLPFYRVAHHRTIYPGEYSSKCLYRHTHGYVQNIHLRRVLR